MKLRVLFFSVLRDLTGCEEVPWTCPPGADLNLLLEQLFAKWPALRPWEPSLLLAVDCTYVSRSHPLTEGCEVAIMPPVQGG
ncbi:MAG: MoaD/ThiS family protein [Prosthecobacter sp.]|jgi:molybdopterin converting factor small subunit|nr:MoaD/ThiS family protein [Prosthecobacter sp.]